MKSKIILLICMLGAGRVMAQVPEDAIRFSWLSPNGTARNQAVGGAMGSLGGDISATFMNPAGLGLYKTGEFVVSPGFSFLTNKSNYRGNATSDKSNYFNLGTSGLVHGFTTRNNKSAAFSIAASTIANFNSQVYYKGENDYSSYSEQYASELSNSKIPIGKALDFDAALSLATKMAVFSYLIDTATVNGTLQVVGLPEFLSTRQQENTVNTKGGITELAFGIATNINDKFYFGGTLGIPIVSYERNSTFTERDISGDKNNDFDYSTLAETFSTKGIGVNAKLGFIFKPVESLRLGLAVHTPTFYSLQDKYHGEMTTETEGYAHLQTVTSEKVNNNQLSKYDYDLVSPWKVLISGSYIFGELEDVTRQKGFISADVEYINYKGSSYQTASTDNSDNSYYDGINKTIDEIYKGSFNFRVGGELKFKTIMARGGFAYYGNPYKDSELKASRMFVSGGLGYRNKGFFVDFTYVYRLQKDVNFPYRLPDKANTFATVKGNASNVILTFGVKI
ncbi:MAG: aromatic hydrocarbon degradation protein [Chitinophagaceae bacterium]